MRPLPKKRARAVRDEQARERDRARYGHSWGFLHEVEEEACTARQVDIEMARWMNAKAEAAAVESGAKRGPMPRVPRTVSLKG